MIDSNPIEKHAYEFAQLLLWRRPLWPRGQRNAQRAALPGMPHAFDVERFLVAKVIVDRRLIRLRQFANFTHRRRAIPRISEKRSGSIHQLLFGIIH